MMEYKNIDYTKLNEQIVKQAFASASQFLTEEQKQKLIDDKFKRAEAYIQARKKIPNLV